MKGRSYSPDRLPFISDTSAYGSAWIAWWTACQPSWRRNTGWPLSKEQHSDANWGKLAARGQSGLFTVVMSTTWWAASFTPTDHQGVFDEAVSDIRWVLEQIMDSLIALAPGVAEVVQNPTPPQGSQKPASMATWQARGDGKRQSKASRKLLESMN